MNRVTEVFLDEVRSAFGEVAARLGLTVPGEAERDRHLAVATLAGPTVRYRVVLGVWDGDVETHVCRTAGPTECKVGVGRLARAAGLTHRPVPHAARTVRQLRKSLTDQAAWLPRLHPLVAGPEPQALTVMRRAGAREWHRPALL